MGQLDIAKCLTNFAAVLCLVTGITNLVLAMFMSRFLTFLLVTGLLSIPIGILGLVGSCRPHLIVLLVFAVFTLPLAFLLVIGGAYQALAFTEETYSEMLLDMIKKYMIGDFEIEKELNEIQKEYVCCGATGKKDYKDGNKEPYNLPKSCCVSEPKRTRDSDGCQNVSSDVKNIGCYAYICKLTIENSVFGAIQGICGFLMICGFVGGLWYAQQLFKLKREGEEAA